MVANDFIYDLFLKKEKALLKWFLWRLNHGAERDQFLLSGRISDSVVVWGFHRTADKKDLNSVQGSLRFGEVQNEYKTSFKNIGVLVIATIKKGMHNLSLLKGTFQNQQKWLPSVVQKKHGGEGTIT